MCNVNTNIFVKSHRACSHLMIKGIVTYNIDGILIPIKTAQRSQRVNTLLNYLLRLTITLILLISSRHFFLLSYMKTSHYKRQLYTFLFTGNHDVLFDKKNDMVFQLILLTYS